jgi:hypothetical protein
MVLLQYRLSNTVRSRYIPYYFCFRLPRSYFTLASALSLVYPPLDPVAAVRQWFARRTSAEVTPPMQPTTA